MVKTRGGKGEIIEKRGRGRPRKIDKLGGGIEASTIIMGLLGVVFLIGVGLAVMKFMNKSPSNDVMCASICNTLDKKADCFKKEGLDCAKTGLWDGKDVKDQFKALVTDKGLTVLTEKEATTALGTIKIDKELKQVCVSLGKVCGGDAGYFDRCYNELAKNCIKTGKWGNDDAFQLLEKKIKDGSMSESDIVSVEEADLKIPPGTENSEYSKEQMCMTLGRECQSQPDGLVTPGEIKKCWLGAGFNCIQKGVWADKPVADQFKFFVTDKDRPVLTKDQTYQKMQDAKNLWSQLNAAGVNTRPWSESLLATEDFMKYNVDAPQFTREQMCMTLSRECQGGLTQDFGKCYLGQGFNCIGKGVWAGKPVEEQFKFFVTDPGKAAYTLPETYQKMQEAKDLWVRIKSGLYGNALWSDNLFSSENFLAFSP